MSLGQPFATVSLFVIFFYALFEKSDAWDCLILQEPEDITLKNAIIKTVM